MGIMKNWIYLGALIEKILKKKVFFNGNELIVYLTSSSELLEVLTCLKYHTEFQFETLYDIFAVDYPSREKRFEIHYLLCSLMYNQKIRLKVDIELEEGVPSVSSLYPCANWLEREVWDMYGIFFVNHPDLRRILTDYGFEGFPLRKDFPVSGFTEVRYEEGEKRIVYEPVELSQEYRLFHFLSPWEKK